MDVEYFTEGKNEKHQNSKIQEYFCQVQKAKHFFCWFRFHEIFSQ